jgi:hypothetical protein
MTRPTDKQRWVLEQLELGGHIIGDASPRVLVTISGPQKKLQDSTYWAMQDRGWLWMAAPGVWRITGRGSAVLAARRAR